MAGIFSCFMPNLSHIRCPCRPAWNWMNCVYKKWPISLFYTPRYSYSLVVQRLFLYKSCPAALHSLILIYPAWDFRQNQRESKCLVPMLICHKYCALRIRPPLVLSPSKALSSKYMYIRRGLVPWNRGHIFLFWVTDAIWAGVLWRWNKPWCLLLRTLS